MTQLDLSRCTLWLRLCEIHYHRPAEEIKGVQYDERVEICVMFVPNVWDAPIDRPQVAVPSAGGAA